MELFEWQKEAIKRIDESREANILVSAPTSAGKTLVGYYFLGIFDGERFKNPDEPVIYTVPIKALANDKYFELKSKGLKVNLITGDVEMVEEDANITICTQEVYRNRFAGGGYKVFIDEIHYIFDNEQRALNYLLSLNGEDRYIFTSATLATEERFAEFLKNLTGREIEVIKTNFRPVELKIHPDIVGMANLTKYRDSLNYVVVFSTRGAVGIASEIAEEIEGGEERKQKIYEKAQQLGIPQKLVDRYIFPKAGVAVYVGKIPYSIKRLVEELAREKLISFVVGTDAIGLGVNFPIDNIFFAQVSKFDGKRVRQIHLREFLQIAGRAGRVGLSNSGNVYGLSTYEYYPYGYNNLVLHAITPLKKLKKMVEEEVLIPSVSALDLLRLGGFENSDKAFEEVVRIFKTFSYPELSPEHQRKLESEEFLKNLKKDIENIFKSYQNAVSDEFSQRLMNSLLNIPEITGSIDMDNVGLGVNPIEFPLKIHQKILNGQIDYLSPSILTQEVASYTNYPIDTSQNLLVVRKIYNHLQSLGIEDLDKKIAEFSKELDEQITKIDPLLKPLLKRKKGKRNKPKRKQRRIRMR